MTAKIQVPESDWPMHDWAPQDIVVDGIVMAVQGLSRDDDNTQVAVLTDEGRELRIVGVRAHGGRVEIIVSEAPADLVGPAS
jgi:phage replication-related protein YjqB (UPF0714/DUF867 family)